MGQYGYRNRVGATAEEVIQFLNTPQGMAALAQLDAAAGMQGQGAQNQGLGMGQSFQAYGAPSVNTQKGVIIGDVVQSGPNSNQSLQSALVYNPAEGIACGVLRKEKCVPGCSTKRIRLKTELAFKIQRLCLRGDDLDCLDVTGIWSGKCNLIAGSNLSSNAGIPAEFFSGCKKNRDWNVANFFNIGIDFLHPMVWEFRNNCEDDVNVEVFAFGCEETE